MLLGLLQAIHGHLGILAAVALLHPAIVLRRGKPLTRRNKWSVGLANLTTLLAFGTGLFIYGDYRRLVKRALFQASTEAGMLFETKEHVAFAVLVLTLGAGAAAWLAPAGARATRRAAAFVFGVAAALCLMTAGFGSYVTAVRGFWQ